MHILISNDDGYFAPGIAALAQAMCPLGKVTVVAPDRDRSGASNSLTLDRPLFLRQVSPDVYHVNGTPSDCVHLAVTGMLESLPDIVVSGINHGANMGDDTVYSGTVAAATEGFLLGVPAMAFSLASHHYHDFSAAAEIAAGLVSRVLARPFQTPVLLNVNIPPCALTEIKGERVTRLGRRHKAEPTVRGTSPRGEAVYWVGPAGKAAEAGEGTDFHAVDAGFVSITPLQIDLTHTGQMSMLQTWLNA